MKLAVFSLVLMSLSLITQAATLGEFVKNTDGLVQTNINQIEATQSCNRSGSRLPTAREFAQNAVKHGSVILEEKDYNASKFPRGYDASDFSLIPVRNIDGTSEAFYYSFKNYQRPTGDAGYFQMWSSSVNSGNFNVDIPFVFNGYYGDIGSDYSGGLSFYLNVARCTSSDRTK